MDKMSVRFEHDVSGAFIRRSLRAVLHGWQLPEDVMYDAQLVVTELVHNVVRHTTDGGELHVASGVDVVRIEVRDASPTLPRPDGPNGRRVGGRGLRLVAALTHAWGAQPTLWEDRPGKVVWAELRRVRTV